MVTDMSYFGRKTDVNEHELVTDQSVKELLSQLLQEIRLLNIRFEEAFETEIQPEDITHED